MDRRSFSGIVMSPICYCIVPTIIFIQSDADDSNKQKPELSADEAAKKAFKTPPKPGEDHEKTINGSKLKWCGRCDKWTDHKTEDHPGGNKDASESSSKKENAEGKLAIHSLTGAMEANF